MTLFTRIYCVFFIALFAQGGTVVFTCWYAEEQSVHNRSIDQYIYRNRKLLPISVWLPFPVISHLKSKNDLVFSCHHADVILHVAACERWMMTSLARQLERLKVPGAHSRLGRDTSRISLIFDPKEAASEDRLSIYHLGMLSLGCFQWEFVLFSLKCLPFCSMF